MASSLITLLHSSEAMHAAGFRYIQQDDTVCCDSCSLEVSGWTNDMDPLTTHSERSPNCEFVRSIQSSPNKFQTSSYSRSLSTTNSILRRTLNDEESSSKRQRTESTSSFKEMDNARNARPRTFSHWPHPTLFTSQMIKAGFFYCNVNDQVICIYCDLICNQWNTEIDDPCEVHKILSPKCLFVKSELIYVDNNPSSTSKIIPALPSHFKYIDLEERRASFLTWCNSGFSSVDELVRSGFFYSNTKITCFYCDGSFEIWEANNHPIAEHVRWFPSCNYARELCGEELYQKIQQSMKHIQGTGELKTDGHQVKVPDAMELSQLSDMVNDRLDLPISMRLTSTEKYNRSIIKRCWENQLRLKNDDFVNECDLFIAYTILQKQIDLIENKKQKIIIPHISMKEIYKKKRVRSSPSVSLNHSKQSYTDILVSFENDLQRYTTARQTLGAQFKEEKLVTIARERSLNARSCIESSPHNIAIGGWILSDTGDYLQCPHCHMRYYQWKSTDDFLLIHRYLSPLCLFVLSTNPLFSSEIPIKYVNEQYTDDDIATAESRPYAGLAQSKQSLRFSVVANRRLSFNSYPNGCPANADQLAIAGFYYTKFLKFIRCFYCGRSACFRDLNAQTDLYLNHQHSSGRCYYTQHINDIDPESSIQQGKCYTEHNDCFEYNFTASNKCRWCMKNDKRLLALPCRHFSLCKECGPTKHTCSKCGQDVLAYVIVYSP